MSTSWKKFLFVITGLTGLPILIIIALYYWVDTSIYKSQLEMIASETLGMEVYIDGRIGISLFPDLHVRLKEIQIRNRGMDIAFAEEASLEIAILPLLHKEIRVNRIGLQGLRISINRDRDDAFTFEKRKETKRPFLTLVPATLSLSNAAFLYTNEKSGEKFEVENLNLDVRCLKIQDGKDTKFLQNLSFTGNFACPEIRIRGLLFSDVKFICKAKEGILTFDPVTASLFSGQGAGRLVADFSDPVPRYIVRASLSKFQIEEYLKTISPEKIAEGSMDFSAKLSMQGDAVKEIKQTAEGGVSLVGENLTLHGNDLDQEFERFESSQNFNLVDAGAFFFAGPLGLAVTTGYKFASIFQGTGGSSSIRKLFSSWKVERGIAQAKDVAMATEQNRIALKGKINFVNERFEDVAVALIDAQGCARVQQKIHGPFRKPVVEEPSILLSLSGSTINLLKQTRDLFTGGTCEVFYTGSVPAP